jgi:hypothetical protein
MSPGRGRAGWALVVVAVVGLVACAPTSGGPATVTPTEDAAAVSAEIRSSELARLAALLEGDTEAARAFYGEDYELVDPAGDLETLDEYLGLIESGRFDYVTWEPTDDMAIRVYGDVAVIRYPSRIAVVLDGRSIDGEFWQMALLQRRDGAWQHVWGQTTPML